jgi:uncharacterized membrane protein
MQRRDVAARKPQERISDSITRFSGSTVFVFLHVVWFGLWILLNINLIHVPYVSEFDPFPFGLLTMIVSLEAIFLSTFVLISQNRMSALSEKPKEVTQEIKQSVKDITGEVEAVQEDVQDVDEEIKRVAKDVRAVKEEMKMRASDSR